MACQHHSATSLSGTQQVQGTGRRSVSGTKELQAAWQERHSRHNRGFLTVAQRQQLCNGAPSHARPVS